MYENINRWHDFAINRPVGTVDEKQMRPVPVVTSPATADHSVNTKIGSSTTKRAAPMRPARPNNRNQSKSKLKLKLSRLAQRPTRTHPTRRLRDHLLQIKRRPSRMESCQPSDGISYWSPKRNIASQAYCKSDIESTHSWKNKKSLNVQLSTMKSRRGGSKHRK